MTSLHTHALRRRPRPLLRDAARELRLLRAVVAVLTRLIADGVPVLPTPGGVR